MKHKATQDLVRLAGVACCQGRSLSAGRTGTRIPEKYRRLPGTITGKPGVRHLAGTVFAYASS